MTTQTKKANNCPNSYQDLFTLDKPSQKPKNLIPSFHDLFQKTIEKPDDNYLIPKLDSLEIIPLEKQNTFRPENFFNS